MGSWIDVFRFLIFRSMEKKKRFSIKNSIRTEFAVIFIIVMVLTIIGYWVINTLLLPKYYIGDKQERLIKTYDKVMSSL